MDATYIGLNTLHPLSAILLPLCLRQQCRNGRIDRVGKRPRVDADQEYENSHRAEHDQLAFADVDEPGDVVVANRAEDCALVHRQCISGAEYQCKRSQRADPEVELDRPHDHQELADKSGCAGQADVGHRKQHDQHRKLRHDVGDAAVRVYCARVRALI